MNWLKGILAIFAILGSMYGCSHEQVRTVDKDQIRSNSDRAMQELNEEEEKAQEQKKFHAR